MTEPNNPNNPNAGVDFPMDEAPPETPVGPRPNPASNPVSAVRSTNPFDPAEEEEDVVNPETQDESPKEQQQACGHPTGRGLQTGCPNSCLHSSSSSWHRIPSLATGRRDCNLPTLLTHDLEDHRTSGFDVSWPLCKMICALAHWHLCDPSAIADEGDGQLFFLMRKDLQRHMVNMMRPKAADEMSQAASTAGGPNDFIDPTADSAGADNFTDSAPGTTAPDDITAPTGTTVPVMSLMTSTSTSQCVEFLDSH